MTVFSTLGIKLDIYIMSLYWQLLGNFGFNPYSKFTQSHVHIFLRVRLATLFVQHGLKARISSGPLWLITKYVHRNVNRLHSLHNFVGHVASDDKCLWQWFLLLRWGDRLAAPSGELNNNMSDVFWYLTSGQVRHYALAMLCWCVSREIWFALIVSSRVVIHFQIF